MQLHALEALHDLFCLAFSLGVHFHSPIHLHSAFSTAHPGLGKGFAGVVTADASKTITISKDGGYDLSNCQCKDDCKSETVKVGGLLVSGLVCCCVSLVL